MLEQLSHNVIFQIAVVGVLAYMFFKKKDRADRHRESIRQQYGDSYAPGNRIPTFVWFVIAGVGYVLYQKVKTGGM